MDRKAFAEHFNANTQSGLHLTGDLDGGGDGIGGQGWVFSCVDVRNSIDLAAKVLKTNHTPDQLDRFDREAELLRQLKHLNILAVEAAGAHTMEFTSGDTKIVHRHPYIVTERADRSLSDLMRNSGRLNTGLAVSLGVQAMSGLAWMHTKDAKGARIIHGDIKPPNILLMGDTVKIADFGISSFGHTDETRTRTQMAAGTGPYMAPEQFEGHMTVQTDIYSLSAVMYEMLAGRRPIKIKHSNVEHMNDAQLFINWRLAHQLNKVAPIRKMTDDGKIDRIVERVQVPVRTGLSVRSRDRFRSAEEMQDAVLEAAERGRAEQRRDRTIFPMLKGWRGGEAADLPALRDEIAGSPTWHTLPEASASPTADETQTSPPQSLVSRRTLLAGFVSLSSAALGSNLQPREPDAEMLMSPEALAKLTRERTAIVGSAERMMSFIEIKASPDSITPILQQFIPYDTAKVANKVRDLRKRYDYVDGAWLGAQMVPYSQKNSQAILQSYLNNRQYREMAIIIAQGVALKDPTDDEQTSWKQLLTATQAHADEMGAERSNFEDLLHAATDPSNPATADTLRRLSHRSAHWAVQALGMAMAAHNPAAVRDEIIRYVDRINKLQKYTANEQDEVYARHTTLEALCTTLAPHAPILVKEAFERLTKSPMDRTETAARRIALELFPYYPNLTRTYITHGESNSERWSTDYWKGTLIGVFGRSDSKFVNAFSRRDIDPYKTWQQLSISPDDWRLADAAYHVIADSSFNHFSQERVPMLVQALLKSRQPQLKRT